MNTSIPQSQGTEFPVPARFSGELFFPNMNMLMRKDKFSEGLRRGFQSHVMGILLMPPKQITGINNNDQFKSAFELYRASQDYKDLREWVTEILDEKRSMIMNPIKKSLESVTSGEILKKLFWEGSNYIDERPTDWPYYLVCAMERLEQEYPDQNAKHTLH